MSFTVLFSVTQVKDHKRAAMESHGGVGERLNQLELQSKAAAEASSTAGAAAGGEDVKKAMTEVEGLRQVCTQRGA